MPDKYVDLCCKVLQEIEKVREVSPYFNLRVSLQYQPGINLPSQLWFMGESKFGGTITNIFSLDEATGFIKTAKCKEGEYFSIEQAVAQIYEKFGPQQQG